MTPDGSPLRTSPDGPPFEESTLQTTPDGPTTTALRTADMEPDELLQPGQARHPSPSPATASGRGAPETEAVAAAVDTKPGLSVRLEKLRAFYGDAEQVKGVDLDFRANQVTAIIGPSGCGKSTMVRCINRMHEEIPGARAEGRVLLDNLDVYDASVDVVAVRRAIGMVFQKPNPFPTMSVFDNVAAGLRLSVRGRAHGDLPFKVEAALRSASLWEEVKDRLGEPGAGLSGGQQQRLCIARSLAVDPEVILMDEPCSALDPIATLKIEELIDQLKARVTIVIVTHNMQQAARVADRTAFMLGGQLIEVGPTQEIFTNPTDPRTEEYVTGKFG
jgi:phosphate transport system ATP-binding protein